MNDNEIRALLHKMLDGFSQEVTKIVEGDDPLPRTPGPVPYSVRMTVLDKLAGSLADVRAGFFRLIREGVPA